MVHHHRDLLYLLICLGASKTFRRVKIWLLASIAYVAGTFLLGLGWWERFFPVGAASLPFSMGSGLYFLARDQRCGWLRRAYSAPALFAAVLANCLLWSGLDKLYHGAPWLEVGLYLNIALFALLVLTLIQGGRIVSLPKSVDRWLGDLSYPVYLFHLQAGLSSSYLLFGHRARGCSVAGLESFALAVPVVLGISVAVVVLVERPLQRLRAKIKAAEKKQGAHHCWRAAGPEY